MIKLTNVTDSMDVNGEIIETVCVTFQKFEGLLSFNVTVPLTLKDVDVPFEEITRKDVVKLARQRVSEFILEGTETEVIPEPPLDETEVEAPDVPEVDGYIE